MKRILAVIPTPTYGGPHNQAFRLYRPLLERGWEIIAVLPEEPGDGAARLASAGMQVLKRPFHRLRKQLDPRYHLHYVRTFFTSLNDLRRLIGELGIDLVQAHSIQNPLGAIAGDLEGVAVVWQLLSSLAPLPLKLATLPVLLRCADVAMSAGRRTAELHPGISLLKERLIPFYPPVDSAVFRPAGDEQPACKARLGVPPDGLVVGALGIVNRFKAYETLAEAAALVLQQFPNAWFRILGSASAANADYQARLKMRIRKLGLQEDDRFKILDPGVQAAELMRGFDIYISTSITEGAPTSMIEAMATGLPAIATRVGSVEEIVADGLSGMLVPPRRPDLTAQAILQLIRDPDLRHTMGENGRRLALEKFELSACLDAHLAAYEMALAHRLYRHSGHQRRLQGT